VVGVTLVLWTHHMGLLFVAAANASVALLWSVRAVDRRSFLPAWLRAQAVVVLLWLPLAPMFRAMVARVEGGFWIPRLTLERIAETATSVFLAAYADPHSRLIGPVLLAAAAAGVWAWRRQPTALIVCSVLILVPWCAEIAVSVVTPALLDRTLIWTAIPFQMLVAKGVLSVPSSRLRALAVAALLACIACDLRAYYGDARKPPWDVVAADVASRAADDDVIVFVPYWVDQPFEYYLRRLHRPIAKVGFFMRTVDEADAGTIAERAVDHARVWLIRARKHAAQQDPYDRIEAALQTRCQPLQRERRGSIDVLLFGRCRRP
jgi:hypothetical protein